MTGNQIVNYDEAWAKDAQRYAQQEAVQGGTFLSTRGGTLMYGDEVMAGNQVCAVILDVVKENTFYQDKFDPDNAESPLCYAFGREADEMAPHPSMANDPEYFIPQADSCGVCPHNEWGSADKGRGKACQNRRRLALIPAGYYQTKRGSRDFDLHLFTDPKHYETADIAFIKLPVTSVINFGKYVQSVAASSRRPPHGVVTRLFLEPDPKSQYKVWFEMLEEIPNELAAIIMARHEAATKSVIQGYTRPQEKQQAAPPQGSLRDIRRR